MNPRDIKIFGFKALTGLEKHTTEQRCLKILILTLNQSKSFDSSLKKK